MKERCAVKRKGDTTHRVRHRWSDDTPDAEVDAAFAEWLASHTEWVAE